jgi:hypothetical protein
MVRGTLLGFRVLAPSFDSTKGPLCLRADLSDARQLRGDLRRERSVEMELLPRLAIAGAEAKLVLLNEPRGGIPEVFW